MAVQQINILRRIFSFGKSKILAAVLIALILVTSLFTLAFASGGAFDYALFSGSSTGILSINGGPTAQVVNGSMHANNRVVLNGGGSIGAIDSVAASVYDASKWTIGAVTTGSIATLPDYTQQIIANATVYTGNKTFTGAVDVTTPIYVIGNVTLNGCTFTGNSQILATGSIYLINSNTGGNICLYSLSTSTTGAIVYQGSNKTVDATLYAPYGKITLNGSNLTLNGAAIGYNVSLNGTGYIVNKVTYQGF